MSFDPSEKLKEENEILRIRLEEAEATLEAIRTGEVDAVVVGSAGGQRVYTLEGTEQFYRVLIEKMQQGAATLSADGTILYCNHAFAVMANVCKEKIAGTRFEQFLVQRDRRRWQECLQQAQSIANGTEIELTPWNREPLPVYLALNPLPVGGAVAVGMILTDLTNQKRQIETDRRLSQEETARIAAQEIAVQASKVRFQARLLDAVGQAAVATDPAGAIVYWNQFAETLYGWKVQEALGRDVVDLIVAPNGVAAARETLTSAQAGAGEFLLRKRDGATFTAFVSATPMFDEQGRLTAVIGISSDITEQKRVEQTLRFLADASATLAALVDWQSTLQKVASLAVPFFADWCAVDIAEPNGTLRRLAVAHVDAAKVRFALELENRYPSEPDPDRGTLHVLRTGKSEMAEDIPDALLVKGARDAEHLRILRELGLRSYMCVPLKTRGKPLGVISFVSAESGRRYTANDLAFAEELAHRAAVSLENAQLYAELREADRLKDEFLAMLAHELRNPLAPIRNSLHIMKQSGTDPDTIMQVREMAERQVQHMARLLDDLLDVSRISRGKIELRNEIVDLKALVNRTIEAIRPVVEERAHELTVSLPALPVRVSGDPTRLEQVITNLLNNSAKYTDPGGHITLRLSRDNDQVVLSVRDDGIGITAEMLPKIFDLFVQAERRIDRSQGGVGIGLTLVRRLVELHGGSIEARSSGPGCGSEFIVRLPASELPTRTDETPIEAQNGHVKARAHRILVVDDNQDAANSLGVLLRLSGQEVETAYSGAAALSRAADFRPALVLLDIGMPGMDGYQVARQIRQDPALAPIVLVAVTGWGQDEDRRRSKEAGFDHHFVKPVDPTTVEQLLTTLP